MKKGGLLSGRLNLWLKFLNQTRKTGKESEIKTLPRRIHVLVSAS